MLKALNFAQKLIKEKITEGDIVIDATCGNGYDSLFLARLVGKSGRVIAFDIQKDAILNTKKRLQKEGLAERVELICDSHSNIKNFVQEEVKAVMFNLGYLPGGNHKVITRPQTTIQALQQCLSLLKKGGIITLICYRGHQGGMEEYLKLFDFCKQLDQKDFTVLEYRVINQKNFPPLLIALEKK